jgi:iron complex outermembrane receptor protein
MNTNHKKAMALGVVCFLAGNFCIYAQEKDTLKSKTIEEVKITIGSRNKAELLPTHQFLLMLLILASNQF